MHFYVAIGIVKINSDTFAVSEKCLKMNFMKIFLKANFKYYNLIEYCSLNSIQYSI